MRHRRVVTGHDDNGKAIIESDGAAPKRESARRAAGFVSTLAVGPPDEDAGLTPGLRIDRAEPAPIPPWRRRPTARS